MVTNITTDWVLPEVITNSLEKYYLLRWSRKFFLLSLVRNNNESVKDQLEHQNIYYDVYYKENTSYQDMILSDKTTVLVSFRKSIDSNIKPVAFVKLSYGKNNKFKSDITQKTLEQVIM